MRLSNVPENAEIKTQFGEFKIVYTKSEKSLKIDEDVRFNVVRVNKDDYPNFRKFLNEIDNKEEADIVLEITTNPN
jgi:DNA-directed RNA polymerase subunit E'/Rpb7